MAKKKAAKKPSKPKSSFEVLVCPHPAIARHPVTRKQLVADGKPVPQHPDDWCLRLDAENGKIIAYVGSEAGADENGRKVLFCVPNLPKPIKEAARAAVADKFGSVGASPEPYQPPPVDDDE